MKGFILAAGLGKRLKPWTDKHPKALALVNGKPMLQRVIERMHEAGIYDITVNVHHFAEQIIEFLCKNNWNIKISDERNQLLETGGAIAYASPLLTGTEPILVHNTDILSNADFNALENAHRLSNASATLLVSERDSSRKLVFRDDGILTGWINLSTGEIRPKGKIDLDIKNARAFSGIYVISPDIIQEMTLRGYNGKFSIIDFFLDTMGELSYWGFIQPGLRLLDIGKPDSLNRANTFLNFNSGEI